jgi:hypothetical protein
MRPRQIRARKRKTTLRKLKAAGRLKSRLRLGTKEVAAAAMSTSQPKKVPGVVLSPPG